MRRLVGLALVVGGPLLYLRQRRERRDRVDVYFDDGSRVTLEDGAPEADALLAVARHAL